MSNVLDAGRCEAFRIFLFPCFLCFDLRSKSLTLGRVQTSSTLLSLNRNFP